MIAAKEGDTQLVSPELGGDRAVGVGEAVKDQQKGHHHQDHLEKEILECAGANGAEIHQQRGNEQRRRYDGIVEQEGNHREDQHQQQLHPAVAQMKKGGSGVSKALHSAWHGSFHRGDQPAAWEQV